MQRADKAPNVTNSLLHCTTHVNCTRVVMPAGIVPSGLEFALNELHHAKHMRNWGAN